MLERIRNKTRKHSSDKPPTMRVTLEQAKKMYSETGECRYAVVVAGINMPIWLCEKREDAEATVAQYYELKPYYYIPDKNDYYVKDLKDE